MKAKDYRLLAQQECSKFSGDLAIIQLLYDLMSVLVIAIGSIPVAGVVITVLVTGPFTFSFVYICEKVKNENKPDAKDLFFGFNRFSQSFVVCFLKNIFIFLWSLLLIVPGIIKSYSYAMTAFIAYDDPTILSNEAITKSREMMEGNKWKLFCLEISYIGWLLLSILTLGILGLWVLPKLHQAKYNFYLNLKKEKEIATKNNI